MQCFCVRELLTRQHKAFAILYSKGEKTVLVTAEFNRLGNQVLVRSPSLHFTPAGELLEEITTKVVTSEAPESNTTKEHGERQKSSWRHDLTCELFVCGNGTSISQWG